MWNVLYILYMFVTAAMAAYGYHAEEKVLMWIGIVAFVIGLLRLLGDDAFDLFDAF